MLRFTKRFLSGGTFYSKTVMVDHRSTGSNAIATAFSWVSCTNRYITTCQSRATGMRMQTFSKQQGISADLDWKPSFTLDKFCAGESQVRQLHRSLGLQSLMTPCVSR